MMMAAVMIWREEKGGREDRFCNKEGWETLERIVAFAMGTAVLAFHHVISFMLHASVRHDQPRVLRSDEHENHLNICHVL